MKPISEAMRRHLLSADPDTRLRVYSIQGADAWEAAQARGFFTTAPNWYADNPDDDDPIYANYHVPAYDWMRDQMAKRIPGFSGDYPVWAWLKRPNMRQSSYFREPNFLVVADIPYGRMLVSDFDLWHVPLNYWFVTRTEAEFDAFDSTCNHACGHAAITPEMLASWEHVFDLSRRTDPAQLAWMRQCDRLQCCIDRIHLDEIVSVKSITGRKGRNGGNGW